MATSSGRPRSHCQRRSARARVASRPMANVNQRAQFSSRRQGSRAARRRDTTARGGPPGAAPLVHILRVPVGHDVRRRVRGAWRGQLPASSRRLRSTHSAATERFPASCSRFLQAVRACAVRSRPSPPSSAAQATACSRASRVAAFSSLARASFSCLRFSCRSTTASFSPIAWAIVIRPE